MVLSVDSVNAFTFDAIHNFCSKIFLMYWLLIL